MRTVRALWWRRGLTFGLGALVLVAVATAVMGQAFSSAAATSLVRERLASAKPSDTGVSWVVAIDASHPGLPATLATARTLPASSHGLFGPAVLSAYVSVDLLPGDPAPVALLAWRQGMCGHLVVTGHCPVQPGEVLVPRGAPGVAQSVGASVATRVPSRSQSSGRTTLTKLTVVGTYRTEDPSGGYWFDPNRWSAVPAAPLFHRCADTYTEVSTSAGVAPLLVDKETMSRFPATTVSADSLLNPGLNEAQARQAVSSVSDYVTRSRAPVHRGDTCTLVVNDNLLGSMLGPVSGEQQTLHRLVFGASETPSLLGLIGIVIVGGALSQARRHEIALAKLRGSRGARLGWIAIGLPAVTITVSAVLGTVVGLAGSVLMARSWLVAAPRPALSSTVLFAAGMTSAVALVSVSLSSVAGIREPLSRQLETTAKPRGLTTGLLSCQIATVIAGVATLYQATRATFRIPGWLALLSPAVVGVAVAVVAAGVLPVLGRLLVRYTQTSYGLGWFLAARRLTRRRDLVVLVIPAVTATAVAALALSAWSSAGTWRDRSAATQVGADERFMSGVDVLPTLRATHVADPDGKYVMAAVVVHGGDLDLDTREFLDFSRWSRVVGPTPGGAGFGIRDAEAARIAAGPREGRYPAVVVDPHVLGSRRSPTIGSFDDRRLSVTTLVRTPALPLIGRRGVALDLSSAAPDAAVTIADVKVYVLARADTPAAVLVKLRAVRAIVGTPVTLPRVLAEKALDPLAQALRFFVVVGLLGAVLTIVTTMAGFSQQRRPRALELASLRATGVRTDVLRDGMLREIGIAVIAVFVSGFAAATLVEKSLLAKLPIINPSTFDPGLDRSTPWLLLVGVSAAVAVLFGGVVALGARRLVADSRAAILREAVD